MGSRCQTLRHFSSKKINISLLNCQIINCDAAQKLLNIGKEKSIELGLAMNIAIVDRGANLVAFLRMDGAWLGSVDIAMKKAKTATYFQMNTELIRSLSQPGGSMFNIEHSNDGLITFPVGVSGSTVENDLLVAEHVAKALKN